MGRIRNVGIGVVAGVAALGGLAVSPAQAERDLATLKACAIVTPEEVAALVGGKLLVEPPATYSFCNYVVEREGDGTESYWLRFVPAATEEPLFDYLLAEGKGEKVAGMLDVAHIGPAEFGSGFSFLAVRHGDVGLEVTGERKEVVLEIAKRAVARLP